TASELQIFALAGDKTQSAAPAIRPQGAGPGVLRAPLSFLSAGAESHTVDLQLVASRDDPACKPTLDDTSRGGMTIRVPRSWKVLVTFANHGTSCTDGLVVADAPGATTPVFAGAQTGAAVHGGGVGYFSFTAEHEGKYVIASSLPKRARSGEWIRFEVVS